METMTGLRPALMVKALMQTIRSNRPAFIWGPPGIGKSDIVRHIAYNHVKGKGAAIDLRLALMDPTDIRGIPFYNGKTNQMEWAQPTDLPSQVFAADFDTVILFLDEMNSAPPSTQAAAYQLVLDGKIGTYTLPDNCRIIAAGNRETDKGVTYKMPSPLANRFVHLELAVHFDDWLEWSFDNCIDSDVIGFLKYSQTSLYDFNPKTSSKAFATPRSWKFVSDLMKDSQDLPEDVINALVGGTVGEGLAMSFAAHRRLRAKLPNPSEILAGTVDELQTNEISSMYSLAINLCYQIKMLHGSAKTEEDTETFNAACNNFFNFILKNFGDELCVLTVQLALQKYKIPFSQAVVPGYGEFYKKYSKIIIAANSDDN